MLISEAFAAYDTHQAQYLGMTEKTRKNYRTGANSLLRAVGDIPVELITQDTVIVWKMSMTHCGNQASSIASNIIKLRNVLKWLKGRGLQVVDYRDIELPKINKPTPTWLNHEEVKLMIEAAGNERDKAIIACLFSTGCRISELLNLNVEDVEDNDEPMVCGKGDKYRTVFIDSTARKYLDDYLATRKDRYKPLFMSGQRARITVSRVQQIVHTAAHEAGIDKRVTPHVFRHSTITDYILNGAPMPLVQQIAGHSSIKTTIDIYTHIQQSDVRKAFADFHSH